MTVYRATLTLHQDAAIGDARAGDQLRTSRDHVPGWVLRGALAGAWIRRYGAPANGNPRREEFLSLFERQDSARFHPLFREGAPLGLSVLEHKRGRGCGKHWDALDCVEWVARGEASVDSTPQQCPSCKTTLEHAKGATPGSGPALRRDFTSALDQTEKPRTSMLFGRESLDHSKVPSLTGFIGASPEQRALLNKLGDQLVIGGSGSTRGLATLQLDGEEGGYETERAHLRIFTNGNQATNALVLRLTSPGVFIDGLGRPSRLPDPTELGDLLGVKVHGPKERPQIMTWTRWVSEGGWHGASGLPKPVERAVAAGSTYLVYLTGKPEPDALRKLTERGLGLRRNEGFGSLLADSGVVERPVEDLLESHGATQFAELKDLIRARFVKAIRTAGETGGIDPVLTDPPARLPTQCRELLIGAGGLKPVDQLRLADRLEEL